MLLKPRKKPLPLKKLEAIIPRVPASSNILPLLQQDLAKRMKGYIGEKKVDYHLNQLAKKFTILHDVYLKLPFGYTIQMDNLILTNHSIYIIESKNYAGTIVFDAVLKQFMRDDGQQITGYNYPITQVENHRLLLGEWLRNHSMPDMPIYTIIAIADPSTIIKVIGDGQAISRSVAHCAQIPHMILDMDKKHDLNFPHQKVGKYILEQCQEYNMDVLSKYDLKMADLLPGVQCPSCGKLKMARGYGCWKCRSCGESSRFAHEKTIHDYLTLGNACLTNKECRKLLQVASRSATTRILKNSNLQFSKEHRGWIKPLQSLQPDYEGKAAFK